MTCRPLIWWHPCGWWVASCNEHLYRQAMPSVATPSEGIAEAYAAALAHAHDDRADEEGAQRRAYFDRLSGNYGFTHNTWDDYCEHCEKR